MKLQQITDHAVFDTKDPNPEPGVHIFFIAYPNGNQWVVKPVTNHDMYTHCNFGYEATSKSETYCPLDYTVVVDSDPYAQCDEEASCFHIDNTTLAALAQCSIEALPLSIKHFDVYQDYRMLAQKHGNTVPVELLVDWLTTPVAPHSPSPLYFLCHPEKWNTRHRVTWQSLQKTTQERINQADLDQHQKVNLINAAYGLFIEAPQWDILEQADAGLKPFDQFLINAFFHTVFTQGSAPELTLEHTLMAPWIHLRSQSSVMQAGLIESETSEPTWSSLFKLIHPGDAFDQVLNLIHRQPEGHALQEPLIELVMAQPMEKRWQLIEHFHEKARYARLQVLHASMNEKADSLLEINYPDLCMIFNHLFSSLLKHCISQLRMPLGDSVRTNIDLLHHLYTCYARFVDEGRTINEDRLLMADTESFTFDQHILRLGFKYYDSLPHSEGGQPIMPIDFSSSLSTDFSFSANKALEVKLNALQQLMHTLHQKTPINGLQDALTAFSNSVMIGLAPPVVVPVSYLNQLAEHLFLATMVMTSATPCFTSPPYYLEKIRDHRSSSGWLIYNTDIDLNKGVFKEFRPVPVLISFASIALGAFFKKQGMMPFGTLGSLLTIFALPHIERSFLKQWASTMDLINTQIFEMTVLMMTSLIAAGLILNGAFLLKDYRKKHPEEPHEEHLALDMMCAMAIFACVSLSNFFAQSLYLKKVIAPIIEEAAVGHHALQFFDRLREHITQQNHEDLGHVL